MATLRDRHAEATRLELLVAAKRLFESQGYDATSIDAVAAEAGATRGAVYHHFASKQALMETVLDRELAALAERVAEVALGEPDPWARVLTAQSAFLDACAVPAAARLLFQEAPAALGWDTWREVDERHFAGMVRGAVADLVDAGVLRPLDPEVAAAVYIAALTEAVRLIARTPGIRPDAEKAVTSLLEGLRTSEPGA